MKSTRSIIIGFFLFLSILSFAQSSLPDSPRFSSEIHIYKMDKESLRKAHLKEEGFDEEMLNNFVGKYRGWGATSGFTQRELR